MISASVMKGLRWSIFTKIRFSLDQFFRAFFLANAHLGISLVVKFSRMDKFQHFGVDIMFAAAKYVFLTGIVPVLEIEGSAAMFPNPNLINQCDLQFLTIKQQNCTLLRILTGKKYRQIKFQRLQNVRIWAFGLLVHQIISLYEILKLKQNFQKYKAVTGQIRSLRWVHFVLTILFVLTWASDMLVFYGNDAFSISAFK